MRRDARGGACRSSRTRARGRSRPRAARARTTWSRSAPTSRRGRSSPPTAPGSSPCRCPRRRPWSGGARTRAGSSRSTRFHLSRSLRRTRKRYEITVDRAFGPRRRGLRRPGAPGRVDHARGARRLHRPARARLGALRRGVGRGRRARRRALRRGDRRALRRRVEVPRAHGRVQGRGRGARGAAAGARRPAPARRPVDDRAPADAGRGRRPARGVPAPAAPRRCRCRPRSGERGRAPER